MHIRLALQTRKLHDVFAQIDKVQFAYGRRVIVVGL
jgi:hypothetical protein